MNYQTIYANIFAAMKYLVISIKVFYFAETTILKMATKQVTDVRDKILEYLENNERTLGYLSGKSGIPYGTIYSIFKQRTFDLNEERLAKINEGLGTDFKS